MDIDFNTQKLVVKPEYINGDVIYFKQGNIIKLTFDPVNTPEDEYAYFFYNGLDMIFDIVDKPV